MYMFIHINVVLLFTMMVVGFLHNVVSVGRAFRVSLYCPPNQRYHKTTFFE